MLVTWVGFRKESFESLLGMLDPLLQHSSDMNRALSSQMQLLCAWRIFRTGTYQIIAVDPLISTVLLTVRNSLNALKPLYVSMPQNQENISRNKRKCYQIGRFPNVIGAIDCLHIPIHCPSGEQAELHRNCKNFFSINTQSVMAIWTCGILTIWLISSSFVSAIPPPVWNCLRLHLAFTYFVLAFISLEIILNCSWPLCNNFRFVLNIYFFPKHPFSFSACWRHAFYIQW